MEGLSLSGVKWKNGEKESKESKEECLMSLSVSCCRMMVERSRVKKV